MVISSAGGVGDATVVGTSMSMAPEAKTSTSSASNMMPMTPPMGRYCRKPARSSAKLMFSIITTKRKSTATAPT